MPSTSLPTRQLGKDGPQVTALGYGAMGLSAFYGAPESDEVRLPFLDRLYELGCWNWDSADMYGDSEDLLGKWFAKNMDKRDNVFVATKFANKMRDDWKFEIRSDPEYVKEVSKLRSLYFPFRDLHAPDALPLVRKSNVNIALSSGVCKELEAIGPPDDRPLLLPSGRPSHAYRRDRPSNGRAQEGGQDPLSRS